MRPVQVDVSLELNSRQLNASLVSLKKIKAKLHNSELVLNDEPPQEEQIAMAEWKRKVHDLFTKEKLEFPTIGVIKAEFDEKYRAQAELDEKSFSYLKKYELPPKTMEALKKSRSHKRFGPCNFIFGPKLDGEVIAEIKDYSGANSIHRDIRPIVRRDYKGSALKPLSGLPPWMGPNYYENTDPKILRHESSVAYSLGKPSENKKSATDIRTMNIMHRSWSPNSKSDRLPSYCQANECHRPQHQYTTPWEEYPPHSKQSCRSTMLVINPLSSATAPPLGPRLITIGEKSMSPQLVGDGHGGVKCIDWDDQASTADSLQAKVSRLGDRTYRVRDYTMEGLSLQAKISNTYLTESFIPDEEDDIASVAGSNNSYVNNSLAKQRGGLLAGETGDHDHDQDFGDDVLHSDNYSSSSLLSFPNGSDHSSLSTDVYRISNIDQAIAEMAEIHGISTAELAENSLRLKREQLEQANSVLIDDDNINDRTAKDFVSYTLSYRHHQRSRQRKFRRSTTISASIPPLTDSIRSNLKQYFKEREVYAPSKPQNTRYLREHQSAPPVVVHGLLLPDNKNQHSKQQIEGMIEDLSIPSSYFALPMDKLHSEPSVSNGMSSTGSVSNNSSASSRKTIVAEQDSTYRVPTSHPVHQLTPQLARIKVVRRCDPRILTTQPILVKTSSTPVFDSLGLFRGTTDRKHKKLSPSHTVVDYREQILVASSEHKDPDAETNINDNVSVEEPIADFERAVAMDNISVADTVHTAHVIESN
jgi:hypothetical protein